MAWGLEARVPFLDKEFLEVSMNIDPKFKQFGKGADQKTDADGRAIMEKVRANAVSFSGSAASLTTLTPSSPSTSSARPSTARPKASPISRTRSSGARRSSSPTVSVTRGSTA